MIPNKQTTDLSKQTRPTDPIGDKVVPSTPRRDASYLDLIGLPSSVLAWLMTRPDAQKNTAAHVSKYAAGQIASGSLLKHDQNVLVLTSHSGGKLFLYPDGGLGSNGLTVDLSPEAIQSVLGSSQSMVAPVAGLTNVVGVPDIESPLDTPMDDPMSDPMMDEPMDPEVSAIETTGGIVEEPMVGDEADPSEIDQWISSLEMELKPRERAQAAEMSVGILDSVGHHNPIRTERRKKR